MTFLKEYGNKKDNELLEEEDSDEIPAQVPAGEKII